VPSLQWYEWDVTSLVNGNGTFSFAPIADSTDGSNFNSRNNASNQPQLVVPTQ
jgi:hypothetical protein